VKTEKQLIQKIRRLEAEVQHITIIAENYKVLYQKLRGKKKLAEIRELEGKNEKTN